MSRWCLLALLFLAANPASRAPAQEAPPSAPHEKSSGAADRTGCQFFQELDLPERIGAAYFDFILPVSVFDSSRHDLGDLRLYDADGNEVPYALRIRRPDHKSVAIDARQFNRTHAADGTAELTLDLGGDRYEHNEVEVRTGGDNFRRRAKLEGSTDAEQWRPLVEKDLVKFSTASGNLDDRRLTYPPSRFRFLRLRVASDAAVDRGQVTIDEITVRRQIELPGEKVTFTAEVGQREPVRTRFGAPGSAWRIDLGGRNVPCESLLVEIADPEFNREYQVESLATDEHYPMTTWIGTPASGTWRRVPADRPEPMQAELGSDFLCARLKLTIADHANRPLRVTGAKFSAPARQIIFARTESLRGPLRLYFGNPAVLPPQYDFDRNLPQEIAPPPQRLALGPRQVNAEYVPPPRPLTERWPWLIYVVLGSVSLLLGVLIVGLGKSAIAQHDGQAAAPAGN